MLTLHVLVANIAILFLTTVIFNVYSTDGIHWSKSSLKSFLQAADMKEMENKDVKELFGIVSGHSQAVILSFKL